MLAALLAMSTAAPAEEAPATDSAVAQLVGGIISYARWPQPQPIVNICVAGAPAHADQLGSNAGGTSQRLQISHIGNSVAIPNCDVLYVGGLSPARRGAILAVARYKPILTIVEDDLLCRSGAMFCLLTGKAPPSFNLNVDAIARSQVKVDPRVLRITGPNP